MFKKLDGVDLVPEYKHHKANLYRLDAPQLNNKYYIVTSASTRRLLNTPEIVGFENYDCMCNPTKVALQYFYKQGLIEKANILTILRGGLNYPLEECCYRMGIPLTDMSFLSCERIFEGDMITGLDVKYKKLSIINKGSLVIGDIIATGDTLVECLKFVVKEYRKVGATLKNIIYFTIGGNMGITVLDNLTEELREYWPDFEGIYCVYYEGIFSTYKDKGVTGINLPFVDFYWKDGVLAPEYREHTLNDDDALFEKCTIYDGGARRYEIPEHYKEVMEYWESLDKIADEVDFAALTDEKFGYAAPASYEEWVQINHYARLERYRTMALYEQEKAYRENNSKRTLKEITTRRLGEFKAAVGPLVDKIVKTIK